MAPAWKLRHDLEWIGHAASSPLSIGNADASGQTPPFIPALPRRRPALYKAKWRFA